MLQIQLYGVDPNPAVPARIGCPRANVERPGDQKAFAQRDRVRQRYRWRRLIGWRRQRYPGGNGKVWVGKVWVGNRRTGSRGGRHMRSCLAAGRKGQQTQSKAAN